MDIKLDKFTYELNNEGSVVGIQIGLKSQNNQGKYLNASLKLVDTDLQDEQKLETLSLTDGLLLAKHKLSNYLYRAGG